MKTVAIVLAVIIAVLLGILLFVNPAKGPTIPATQVGPIVSADGNLAITLPASNAVISSPVSITGTVTNGGWFDEAVFPIKILDGDGTVLGIGQAQAGGAPGSWMSTGTVPFTATITFTGPNFATGTILFQNDNPSGDLQNAKELRLPVRFQ